MGNWGTRAKKKMGAHQAMIRMPDRALLYAIAGLVLLYLACAKPTLGALLVIVCFILLYVRPTVDVTKASPPEVAARHSNSSIAATTADTLPESAPSVSATEDEELERVPVDRLPQGGEQQRAAMDAQVEGRQRSARTVLQPDWNRYMDSVEDDHPSLSKDDMYMSFT